MQDYNYTFQHIEDARDYIEKLQTAGRDNISLNKELTNLTNNRFGVAFCIEDGMLHLHSSSGFLMPIREIKKIVSFLEYTIENFDEKKSIENEIKDIKEWIEYKKKPIIKEEKKVKEGYVYLVIGENGRYKIGCSRDVEKRIQQLKTSSCENHELVYKFKCKNPYEKEQELHEKFNNKRVHSEWFELTKQDVQFIKGIKNEI